MDVSPQSLWLSSSSLSTMTADEIEISRIHVRSSNELRKNQLEKNAIA